MKTPGLNGQIINLDRFLAAEQRHSSIKVESKEEEFESRQQINTVNPELHRHPDWCNADIVAEIRLYKDQEEEEAAVRDDRESNWEETKTEETDELQQSLTGPDGMVLVFQEDDKLSQSLKTAKLSDAGGDSEAHREENSVIAPERRETGTKETSEPGDKGK